MRYLTPTVLYTKVDAQYDKLATENRRLAEPPSILTILETVDVQLRKFKSLGQCSRGKYFYFWRYPNSLLTQCRIS